jgi:hypothetical protein
MEPDGGYEYSGGGGGVVDGCASERVRWIEWGSLEIVFIKIFTKK